MSRSTLQNHQVAAKQHKGAYRAVCSCGADLGSNHTSRADARKAGARHQRQIAPHLCGPS